MKAPAVRLTKVANPVLRETRYDRVSAGTMALFVGIALFCGCMILIYATTRLPRPIPAVPVELVEFPGGVEDGAPDETLRVDSSAPESPDATPADTLSTQMEIQESIETAMEFSDHATEMVQKQFELGIQNTGKAGSAKGTGRRGLGSGPGRGGFPREQRWYLRFGDNIALEEYARQLGFFGIELGVLLPNGRLAYMSKLTQPVPQVRIVDSGANEKRMYMTWQGGDRRGADVSLCKRAGLEVFGDSTIFHFYPPETEQILARLELEAAKRSVSEIRRTYFAVNRPLNGVYEFQVVRQIFFQTPGK